MKIVAVLYPGGEIAKRTPAILGSAALHRHESWERRWKNLASEFLGNSVKVANFQSSS